MNQGRWLASEPLRRECLALPVFEPFLEKTCFPVVEGITSLPPWKCSHGLDETPEEQITLSSEERVDADIGCPSS
jgi:hypothetical protein